MVFWLTFSQQREVVDFLVVTGDLDDLWEVVQLDFEGFDCIIGQNY